jgi:hypothetical protein
VTGEINPPERSQLASVAGKAEKRGAELPTVAAALARLWRKAYGSLVYGERTGGNRQCLQYRAR